MQLDERDQGYLWDIKDACIDIIKFMQDISFSEFSQNKMRRFAVERQLLVIGEAAAHLSVSCRDVYNHIPWKLIIGLRNIIAHEYGEILEERIYRIAIADVPELRRSVSEILSLQAIRGES